MCFTFPGCETLLIHMVYGILPVQGGALLTECVRYLLRAHTHRNEHRKVSSLWKINLKFEPYVRFSTRTLYIESKTYHKPKFLFNAVHCWV
jgi:hypothetical protein